MLRSSILIMRLWIRRRVTSSDAAPAALASFLITVHKTVVDQQPILRHLIQGQRCQLAEILAAKHKSAAYLYQRRKYLRPNYLHILPKSRRNFLKCVILIKALILSRHYLYRALMNSTLRLLFCE
jgi:hypothetical protein